MYDYKDKGGVEIFTSWRLRKEWLSNNFIILTLCYLVRIIYDLYIKNAHCTLIKLI